MDLGIYYLLYIWGFFPWTYSNFPKLVSGQGVIEFKFAVCGGGTPGLITDHNWAGWSSVVLYTQDSQFFRFSILFKRRCLNWWRLKLVLLAAAASTSWRVYRTAGRARWRPRGASPLPSRSAGRWAGLRWWSSPGTGSATPWRRERSTTGVAR